MGSAPRYGIYFAPNATSELWHFGSSVIGYDASTGLDVPHHQTDGFEAEHWSALTAESRRYGFHATLKAPFRLTTGVDEPQLIFAVRKIAASMAALPLGPLSVRRMGRFIVLRPEEGGAAVSRLAARVVDALEPLRAPLNGEELARRLREPLSTRQVTYLERYGYPHVLEDFRFHMTLAGPIEPELLESVESVLRASFARHVPNAGTIIDGLTIFRQDRRTERFRIIHRALLSGATG